MTKRECGEAGKVYGSGIKAKGKKVDREKAIDDGS